VAVVRGNGSDMVGREVMTAMRDDGKDGKTMPRGM